MRLASGKVLTAAAVAALLFGAPAWAAAPGQAAPGVFGIPFEFVLFALTLAGVALLHHRTLLVALVGLAAVVAYEAVISGFPTGFGAVALVRHLQYEWVTLSNLFLLLVGFELLSNQFERSNLPDHMPRILPDDWTGGVALLAVVFGLSAFLDNIAAAAIGGIMARHVYQGRVRVGFLACIVAAANAGGAGSVVGDTTTTIMWLHGVPPLSLTLAYLGSVPAFVVFALLGAWSQQRHQPILAHDAPDHPLDPVRIAVVAAILVAAVAANVTANILLQGREEPAPILGLAVWAAILVTSLVRRPDWRTALPALKGALFLVALVASASLMPVTALPPPSWSSTLGLGFVSAVFDNIPLTALALQQGGYDWPMLAYAVGFGGSMVWFGSSAGVALTNLYPEGRSVGRWLKEAWFVPVAYLVGFAVMLWIGGWTPDPAPAR